jgi:hypothetical protein
MRTVPRPFSVEWQSAEVLLAADALRGDNFTETLCRQRELAK